MASKAIYTVVAVAGIAVASAGAWWFQHKPGKPATVDPSAPAAGTTQSGGATANHLLMQFQDLLLRL